MIKQNKSRNFYSLIAKEDAGVDFVKSVEWSHGVKIPADVEPGSRLSPARGLFGRRFTRRCLLVRLTNDRLEVRDGQSCGGGGSGGSGRGRGRGGDRRKGRG